MTGEPISQQIPTEAQVENLHIRSLRPLIPPDEVKRAYPASEQSISTVIAGREAVRSALDLDDPYDKLIVVTGGCSVHDADQALEYTSWLKGMRGVYGDQLELIQRVYFEKPRTTIGWEGFIMDPHLDGSFDINYGVMAARKLVCKITDAGVPIGTELLENILIDYYAGLVSWGAIGARTTESQLHKHMASGLSFPVGFKNGTSGDIQVAVDGVLGAGYPHHFPATTDEGRTAIAETRGNPDCHIILRGGKNGPNYDAASVEKATGKLKEAGLSPVVMIDASHANSNKDFRKQTEVIRSVAAQVASGSTAIIGVMIEANLREGKQKLIPDEKPEYGISITDGCVGLPENERMFELLATAVEDRRQLIAG